MQYNTKDQSYKIGKITYLVPNFYAECQLGPYPFKCVNLVPNLLVLCQFGSCR